MIVRITATLAALTAIGTSLPASPASAAVSYQIDIPASRLSDALVALGRQANISIGAASADISGARVRPLRGRFGPEHALQHLLEGTGFSFVRFDAVTFRIVRAPPVRVARSEPPARRPETGAPPPAIIVTGSKRSIPLDRYPATVDVVDLQGSVQPVTGASGSATLLANLPMLASTQLGRGRNKLFIRGVADSSFTGPTQATVGQYLGEVRLNYNAPDPDLSLYDIARVEVIEGPQGTLYGAGTLGGVLRLIPNPPELDRTAGSVAVGTSETRRGAPSDDLAGMANVPIVPDVLGLRIVAYRDVEGGYINDLERALPNVNRMRISGGRATLRINAGSGWTIDLGGAFQWIATRDSQYTDLAGPALSRRSAIAQPFDNDYQLWHATLRKSWHGIELVSASGFVQHDVSARYDATPAGASQRVAFDEEDAIRLFTHETRLSTKGSGDDGWVVGVALVDDFDQVKRSMGAPGAEDLIAGIRNSTFEASIFGEISIPIAPRLTGTIGGRLTYSRLSGEPLVDVGGNEFEPDRDGLRALPSIALAWRAKPQFLVFARYQEGFRAGGLSIVQTASGPAAKHFRSDRIATAEAGVRFGRSADVPLTGAVTVSYARWQDIQADLIEPSSLPSTANIGNGRVYGLELSARWRPSRHLSTTAAVFLNDSTLVSPAAGFEQSDIEDLPNIARTGIAGVAEWRTTLGTAIGFAVRGSGRYVGKSKLGVGPALDLSQGDYFDGSFDARLSWKQFQLTAGVTNVVDARANRFALGNPFGPTAGRQSTPLRPRTVRIGLEAAF